MLYSTRPLRLSSVKKLDSAACFLCQWRSFSSSYRQLAAKETKEEPASSGPPPLPPIDAPRATGRAVDKFTPKPLGRPIGIANPPKAGENSGVDKRTFRQKRDDFVNYDKHLEKRKQLTRKMATPYFREWSNMQWSKGKSFLMPPSLFKADRALYFPNFQGQTLEKRKKGISDTTPVLQDKVSVVSIFSSAWAENQVATFASEKQNPELHDAIRKSGGLAQMVQINIEENTLKAWIIKLFMPSLRRRIGASNLARYFLVRRGVTEDTRDAIGLLNSKVGYTYLVDGECRIRWAGSGPSQKEEREGLVKGVNRLVAEANAKKSRVPAGGLTEGMNVRSVGKSTAT
ncbi:ATP10 protein [Phlyctema vagabunda]|uniref:ATP10 protein n=1 Tax=Phlyctema vagabunda TaxID=108571 RepID=A0ABR4PCC2_9HELO